MTKKYCLIPNSKVTDRKIELEKQIKSERKDSTKR